MSTYKVKTWNEFTTQNGSSELLASDTIYFDDSFIDSQTGQFNGAGSGTQSSPYICGTYNELLKATGAPNIYYLKMVKEMDDANGYHTYFYNNKYAKHDRSLTTIDFSALGYTSGYNNIQFNCHCNFNGWTLLNLRFYPNKKFFFNILANINVRNLILLNCYWSSQTTNFDALFYTNKNGYGFTIYDSIIDVEMQDGVATTSYYRALGYTNGITSSFYRCSFAIRGNIYAMLLGTANSTSYEVPFYDCLFNFDFRVYCFYSSTGGATAANLNNCLLTGQINFTSNGSDRSLAKKMNSCIVDCSLKYGTSKLSFTVIANGTMTLYNTDKTAYSSSYSTYQGVTTEQLKQPQTLRNYGFPIAIVEQS